MDTHIFLWLINEPERIAKRQLAQIEDVSNNLFLSSISIVELAIKESIGKIKIDFDALKIAKEVGLEVLSFSEKDAVGLFSLPYHHGDPFDRMIISQAVSNDFYLLSADSKFRSYDCKML